MQDFPIDDFLNATVQLLEYIEYQDCNYTRDERIENLRYAYEKAAQHFAQDRQQALLKAEPKRLQASLQTIVGMAVCSWAKVSKELMADLSIYNTYTLVLDDSQDDPHPQMLTYFDDLQAKRQQKHPYTLDFFEGCWIEQYSFRGYHGSYDYLGFLRRMNGLGHCVGASLWPKDQFDERNLFREITTAVARMENWMTSLVNNYVATHGLTLGQALEKLIQEVLLSSKQMMAVFADKDPQLRETISRFMHGYVTWHLCDDRYRLSEIYARAKTIGSEDAVKFTKFPNKPPRLAALMPTSGSSI
ncbi:hypothetical protein NQ176_g8143 [Zarea fungicola]|uniref:Uncharacterized protein n=1 Tax=Zarea fungicola TaxID=93591 RepID=A0ACC1MWG3_9HYPO|nr:hypothetical protein NQ176_g8143 [Lecanicillium fungicola]